MDKQASTVEMDKIKLDPNQPRKHFYDVESLAVNMKLEGLIHPIEIDSNYILIVGERRYRAAKQLGWKNIGVTIHKEKMTPYERLRRQMSENLHQSAAKNGESMNPMDTAHGWVRLYELKTGGKYEPGSHKEFVGSGRGVKGPLAEIADEIAADRHTVWELLKLLEEPEYIQKAIEDKKVPRTYIREANNASKSIRNKIKKKIVEGEYKNREEIIQDVTLSRKFPDLALAEVERKRSKTSYETNNILNAVNTTVLALEKLPLSGVAIEEKGLIVTRLEWLINKINEYIDASPTVVDEKPYKTIKGEVVNEA